MNKNNEELATNVIAAGREAGINMSLFRNSIGVMLHLNPTDMECLDLLFYRQIASPSELATYTGLSSSATTAMLDRLERNGILRRQPNPNDRRGVLITINASAVQEMAPFFASVRDAQHALLAHYSREELQLLMDYQAKTAAIWAAQRQMLGSRDLGVKAGF